MRSTAQMTVRPRYGVFDVIGLLFRELLLMIVIFLVIFAVGTAAVLTLKKSYTANAAIYAGAGQEYAYEPRVGVTERGSSQMLTADAVASNEAAILGSLEVKRRALQKLGADVVLGPDATGTAAAKQTAALKVLDEGLGVGVTPGSPVIALSFEAGDPQRAARILNAIIDEYLIQRREIFRDVDAGAIAEQRGAFESELAEADDSYNAFLASNDLGDFTTAKTTLAATYQTTYAAALDVRAQLNQARQRVTTLEQQLARQPAEVVLQQDLNVAAQDQIRTARTDRANLLSRYTEDAQPVRELDEKIAELEAYVAAENTVGVREVRTGPSVIYTEIETARIQASADRDALAARLAVLDSQLETLRARQARLNEIDSTNTTLASDREVLTTKVREFQQRETESRADSALVAAGADNVRVAARAEAPTKGKSLKIPLLAAVFLFAGFTALCIGLLRIFMRKGFPTPASAGRTLQMPVLAVAPAKAH
ncbi:MAG: chain-length determining protein [Brevundimonas sp.]|nr:MAG: chain-length determining protein [Brevundimonas sp.]